MVQNPTEGDQPIPAKEPFEVWWPKYIESVNKSVAAAEEYLEVPSGTISSIPRDADFIATVKMYAVIEPVLNDLISARPPQPNYSLATLPGLFSEALTLPEQQRANFRTFVTALNIGGRTGKVRLAEGLGLLTVDQVRFIEGVARVRNRYAHNVKNMHRSLEDIVAEEQQSNGRIVEHVTGLQGVTLPAPILSQYFKLFMYHRLADYLSNALHTLRPPPLPGGGLLGDLILGSYGSVRDKTDEQDGD